MNRLPDRWWAWRPDALVWLAAIAFWGCPSRPPAQRRASRARRAVVPTSVQTHTFTVEAPAEAEKVSLPHLPPFPKFRDPYPLPKRSLNRERRLGFTAKGRARMLVHSHLAARMWALANRNLQRIRRLESRARRRGRPAPRDRIASLRKEAAAHLRECVTLLDGVLERKDPPGMARVRLAHYLRELKPNAAIPHFRILVRDTRDATTRRRYALDLAQLLIMAKRPAEAVTVLQKNASPLRSARGRLLAALARAQAGQTSRAAGPVGVLAGECDRLAPSLRASFLAALPALLSADPAPERRLVRLARRAPGCWKRHGSRLASRSAQALLQRGRPSRAADLVRAATAQGATIPAALRGRVKRLGGPWSPLAAPPAANHWKLLVQRRVASLDRCFRGRVGRERLLSLRVEPGGSTRVLGPPAPPPAHRGARSGAKANGALPCLRRVVARWRFPGWRAPRAVELRVRITRPASR